MWRAKYTVNETKFKRSRIINHTTAKETGASVKSRSSLQIKHTCHHTPQQALQNVSASSISGSKHGWYLLGLPQTSSLCSHNSKEHQVLLKNNEEELLYETAANMKMAVFWDVAPCSLVEVYRSFRGACCFHHQQ
jgi:hypothetical protein